MKQINLWWHLESIEADPTFTVDVRMIDLCQEPDLRRFEGIPGSGIHQKNNENNNNNNNDYGSEDVVGDRLPGCPGRKRMVEGESGIDLSGIAMCRRQTPFA